MIEIDQNPSMLNEKVDNDAPSAVQNAIAELLQAKQSKHEVLQSRLDLQTTAQSFTNYQMLLEEWLRSSRSDAGKQFSRIASCRNWIKSIVLSTVFSSTLNLVIVVNAIALMINHHGISTR